MLVRPTVSFGVLSCSCTFSVVARAKSRSYEGLPTPRIPELRRISVEFVARNPIVGTTRTRTFHPMLTVLKIRNLALVDDLTWEVGSGLVCVTGETGAGK